MCRALFVYGNVFFLNIFRAECRRLYANQIIVSSVRMMINRHFFYGNYFADESLLWMGHAFCCLRDDSFLVLRSVNDRRCSFWQLYLALEFVLDGELGLNYSGCLNELRMACNGKRQDYIEESRELLCFHSLLNSIN